MFGVNILKFRQDMFKNLLNLSGESLNELTILEPIVNPHTIQCTMPVGNKCSGQACTKACLVTRIIKHIEQEGYLPIIMSPCMHMPGAPYWIWTNRYQGNLVVVDIDAPAYPHLNSKWEVSLCFQLSSKPWRSQPLETGTPYPDRHCCSGVGVVRLWKWPHQYGTHSTVLVLPGAGRTFWDSHPEMPCSCPALCRSLCTKHRACKSSLANGGWSLAPGNFRLPYLCGHPWELFTEKFLWQPVHNLTSLDQPALAVCHYEVLE